MGSKQHSYLDLARAVDGFPYQIEDPEAYAAFTRPYYRFRVRGLPHDLGLVPSSVVDHFEWPGYWSVDSKLRTLTLVNGSNAEERSELFAKTLDLMVRSAHVPILKKLRQEMLPTYGPDGELLLNVDRAACILFGTVAYGVQMIAYVRTDAGVRYWVPRRAKTRESYPNMLDNCVGGALNSGETPLETLVREAAEEASLPQSYVRTNAKPYGVLSYHMATDGNGNEGHQPQVQYVYHIELTPEIKPTPMDGEVEHFEQMDLEQVQRALASGEFKNNCTLTWIFYLIMLGIITPENEEKLYAISCHLHRRLDFPTR